MSRSFLESFVRELFARLRHELVDDHDVMERLDGWEDEAMSRLRAQLPAGLLALRTIDDDVIEHVLDWLSGWVESLGSGRLTSELGRWTVRRVTKEALVEALVRHLPIDLD